MIMKVWVLGLILASSAACRSTADELALPYEEAADKGTDDVLKPQPHSDPKPGDTEPARAPEASPKSDAVTVTSPTNVRKEPITIASNTGIGVNNGSLAFSTLYCGLLNSNSDGLVLLDWQGKTTHHVVMPLRGSEREELLFTQTRACLLTGSGANTIAGSEELPTLHPRHVLLTEQDQIYIFRILTYNPTLESCIANAKALNFVTSPNVLSENTQGEFTGYQISLRDVDVAGFLTGDCQAGSVVDIKY